MKTKIICLITLFGGIATTALHAAPLQVALVETLSGPQASTGLMYRASVKYQLDRINAAGGWNGEPIQLVEYDNQGGPSGASDKLKAAIANGAQIIIQGSSSAVAGQITEDVRKHNLRNPGNELLYFNMGAEALEMTGSKCHFYHFRFITNTQVRIKTLVAAMAESKELGKDVYSMYQNYSAGMDFDSAVKEYAKTYGYNVVESTPHDVNKIQDFAPYVSKIKASNAQTVITGNWSNDLLLLMKATRASGLKVRFGTVFLDQVGNVGNAGDTALGHYVTHPFNMEANGKQTEQFGEDYKAKTGHYPVFVEPGTVFGMMMIGKALNDTKPVNGKMNVTELAKNLEKATISTPMGQSKMRAADHQLLLPVVVSKVTKEAKFKVDGTDMGFTPVKLFTADEAATPVQASCNMQRPS